MSPGESRTEKIPCDEAYGQRREEMVFDIEREQMPEDLEPALGQRLTVGLSNNQEIQVVVVEVSESKVSVDANHPLAGKDLIFQIELVDIL